MKGRIPPDALSRVKRILIIQYKPFGDVLLNTAYLPALREAFPDSEIEYLVQRPYNVILQDNPSLDRLLIMERRKKGTAGYARERLRVLGEIRRRGYDMVIDQARGPASAWMTLASCARHRLGWHRPGKWSNLIYNHRAVRDHRSYAAKARFGLLEPLGIRYDGSGTFMHITGSSREKAAAWFRGNGLSGDDTVIISPVTPIARRQWNLRCYGELADMIVSRTGLRVVFLWGPGELEKVREITSGMKRESLAAPATTFNEAGAFLEKARAYIGNNGGVHHLATAMGTPTLTIFGPGTNPWKWTAWHMPVHRHVMSQALHERTDDRLGLEPGEVFQAFSGLLDYLR
ncbi:MAG TPA: glycosyltransferase family 9 protein [Candidatus Sabulitectum sp.]|nr:glycosyltransferase family 9 protein [Candidatus Sabulitectum sp.]